MGEGLKRAVAAARKTRETDPTERRVREGLARRFEAEAAEAPGPVGMSVEYMAMRRGAIEALKRCARLARRGKLA